MASTSTANTDRPALLADLLARTALADQKAFAELYRLTSSQMYAVALRILRESAAAEEILQECYVTIWHRAGSYERAKSQAQTWLTSIVRNRCLDRLRRREVDTVTLSRDDGDEADLDFASDGATPVELLLDGAAAKSVRQCVDALEGAQKQAIALAFYHGLTHAELALHLRE